MLNKLFLNKKTIFLFGTIVAYLGLFFARSFPIYALTFIWFFFITYIYLADIKKAVFLTSLFALPYSQGRSFLSIDDTNLFTVTPFAVSVLVLSVLSIKDKLSYQIDRKDILLFLFFVSGIVSYLFANTSFAVLNGILRLSIYILFYILAKRYLSDEKIKRMCIFILISMVIFESGLTILQFGIGHPFGKYIEEVVKTSPYGKFWDEDYTVFRPTGTFKGPNSLSSFLTIILPFIFLLRRKTVKFLILLSALVAIFLSFTRFSWMMSILVLIIVFWLTKPKINFSRLKLAAVIPTVFLLGLTVLILFPYFQYKISLTGFSITDISSIDTRMKLNREAISLVAQYPVFGVGLNQFSDFAVENNITGIFKLLPNIIVHNVPLLISAEIGIPALVFFMCFVFFSYSRYFISRKRLDKNDRDFKDIAALGGLIYFLEANMVTLFPAPHFSLFLLYMAIINS